MLDKDLADLYEVKTSQLKRQVRRNLDRFPEDFMYKLNEKETNMMVCQIGIPSKSYFGGARPFAFTEQGIAMLSSVLNSEKAIRVNIQIMRAFIKVKKMIIANVELKALMEKVEKQGLKIDNNEKSIHQLANLITQMIRVKEDKRKIGFKVDKGKNSKSNK